jgi:stage V sporulation protein G
MEISEVRVKLVSNPDDRLKAFCSMTIDNEFVIRDIKVIEGTGGLFVAMPSRKMSDHCPRCGGKNYLRAKFCSTCGAKLPENRVHPDVHGHMKLHADIAHPINAKCRRKIQETILRAFHEEVERSKEPGYKPVSFEDDAYQSDESQDE